MNVTGAATNPGWSTAFGAMIWVTNEREEHERLQLQRTIDKPDQAERDVKPALSSKLPQPPDATASSGHRPRDGPVRPDRPEDAGQCADARGPRTTPPISGTGRGTAA